ncbi:uncharacterized protein B0T15DRAFT_286818 [Chaetomium strumarium]|uniref:Uncharacterized protein n=1 Tax=Chaetomium strumarium TaxID=1170767 RepID=A0AAJ0GL38_9PEZI|nr:hypothetical protein B0T15DRAFT_286818 [Chaetomium strumarium]
MQLEHLAQLSLFVRCSLVAHLHSGMRTRKNGAHIIPPLPRYSSFQHGFDRRQPIYPRSPVHLGHPPISRSTDRRLCFPVAHGIPIPISSIAVRRWRGPRRCASLRRCGRLGRCPRLRHCARHRRYGRPGWPGWPSWQMRRGRPINPKAFATQHMPARRACPHEVLVVGEAMMAPPSDPAARRSRAREVQGVGQFSPNGFRSVSNCPFTAFRVKPEVTAPIAAYDDFGKVVLADWAPELNPNAHCVLFESLEMAVVPSEKKRVRLEVGDLKWRRWAD